MERILKHIWILGLISLFFSACKDNDLENFEPIKSGTKVISADGAAIGQLFRKEDLVMIPIKIKLSGPAEKAFQVGIENAPDTVNTLIANNTLQGVDLLESNFIEYPSVINVAYGTDSASVLIGIKMTGIERHFDKKIAVGFKLTSPEKGNSIDPNKNVFVIVVDTKEITTLDEIHYLSFVNHAGEVFEVPRGADYSITSSGISVPLNINLGGAAGKAFSLRVVNDVDTIDALIANDPRFSNAIRLPDFEIDTLVRFKSGVNNYDLSLSIPWEVFDANMTAKKKFAVAFRLADASRHVLQSGKDFVILLFNPAINEDNNSFIFGNGDGINAEYWTNTQFLGYSSENPAPGEVPNPPFASRVEENIDWGNGGRTWQPNIKSPSGATISGDNYSSRWYGYFLAPIKGEYTFYQTRWDDGSRLFIDDVAIINDYTTQWDKPSRKAVINLERGEIYKIEAHHRENVGGQQAHLEYEVRNANGEIIYSKRHIQKSQLYTERP